MIGDIICCWIGSMICSFWLLWPLFGFKAFVIICLVFSVIINLLAGGGTTEPTTGGGGYDGYDYSSGGGSSDSGDTSSEYQGPDRDIWGRQNSWDTWDTKEYVNRAGDKITLQSGPSGYTVLENGFSVIEGNKEDSTYNNMQEAYYEAEKYYWWGLEEDNGEKD